MKLISLYFFSPVISSKLIYEPVEIVKDEKEFVKKFAGNFRKKRILLLELFKN